jgi:hypothetical protein
LPVIRQPPAGWHTFVPVPRSTQRRVQQPESLSHGTPSCPQPPAASWQRPGSPGAAGRAHRPEQQSSGAAQMSPVALQVDAGAHQPCVVAVAPWQLCEQQSKGALQRSPSVVQLPTGGSAAHWPAAQTPEQHVSPDVQLVPMVAQRAAAQVAPAAPASGQLWEQHSESEVQGVPAAAQATSGAQDPDAQIVEQHSPPLAQVSLAVLQAPAGATSATMTANVRGVFVAFGDDTVTVAVYLPAASEAVVARTESE